MSEANITVKDPFGAADDPALPALKLAPRSIQAKEEFKRRLPRLAGEDGIGPAARMRVIRHKPGKRCVIDMMLRSECEGLRSKSVTLYRQSAGARYGTKAIVCWSRLECRISSRLP